MTFLQSTFEQTGYAKQKNNSKIVIHKLRKFLLDPGQKLQACKIL